MSSTLLSRPSPQTMSSHDPCSEAEWILESIVDDFAQSLDSRDRALFYTHLAELIAGRLDGAVRCTDGADEEPGSPLQVH